LQQDGKVVVNHQIKPIEDSKKTIAAIVQDRIRDAIMTGALPAGSRIDQARLAADLNVSLVPVREALKKLEAEGFVQIVPRRGAFVTQISVDDMEELYAARQLLEGEAAFHAANGLSNDDLVTLESLMVQMNQALHAQDYQRFSECNRRFHFVIYARAGNRYLVNMINTLWELAERYRYRYVFMRDRADVIQKEHQAILDACKARDKKALQTAINHHMHHTLLGIRSYILSREPAKD
jgi:DNA-binding GntR family transcriptional regulator